MVSSASSLTFFFLFLFFMKDILQSENEAALGV